MLRHLPRRLLAFFLKDPGLFLRYVSIGAVAALTELGLFTAAYELLGWPLLAANLSALSVSMLVSFAGQKSWTFRARGAVSRQLRLFIVMQVISVGLNNFLVWLMIACWNWYPPLAKVIQIGLVFAWNFGFTKRVVFPASQVLANKAA